MRRFIQYYILLSVNVSGFLLDSMQRQVTSPSEKLSISFIHAQCFIQVAINGGILCLQGLYLNYKRRISIVLKYQFEYEAIYRRLGYNKYDIQLNDVGRFRQVKYMSLLYFSTNLSFSFSLHLLLQKPMNSYIEGEGVVLHLPFHQYACFMNLKLCFRGCKAQLQSA